MELVAFLGSGKEGLGQISGLMNRLEAEKIIIVKDSATENPFGDSVSIVSIDAAGDILALKEEMKQKLSKELSGEFEVVLSLASGNGKEHMALVGALLSIPVGIRIAVFTKNNVEFLT